MSIVVCISFFCRLPSHCFRKFYTRKMSSFYCRSLSQITVTFINRVKVGETFFFLLSFSSLSFFFPFSFPIFLISYYLDFPDILLPFTKPRTRTHTHTEFFINLQGLFYCVRNVMRSKTNCFNCSRKINPNELLEEK